MPVRHEIRPRPRGEGRISAHGENRHLNGRNRQLVRKADNSTPAAPRRGGRRDETTREGRGAQGVAGAASVGVPSDRA
jgi:hypothetical protein